MEVSANRSHIVSVRACNFVFVVVMLSFFPGDMISIHQDWDSS